MSRLKPCPECGCPDELELDSSCAAEASWIECGWCEHRMQRRCDEETLVVKWNALGRKKMPEFDLEEEMAKLDKAPSQPRCEQCARLRKTGWFWYWEAKKAQRALAQQPTPVTPVGVELLCRVYADAYHAGHHATVEGNYVDVLPVDRDTYWREKVEEDYPEALAGQQGGES